MKHLIVILSILTAFTLLEAKPITIKICKEKDYDCQYIHLEDVKNIAKINSGDILRITFFDGRLLDIYVANKFYEIKK